MSLDMRWSPSYLRYSGSQTSPFRYVLKIYAELLLYIRDSPLLLEYDKALGRDAIATSSCEYIEIGH
jgi:hypothetical protein